ncbi:MAG: four helix bundle protein [Deltaproteobacteria bacterium]|nr:four helix bundle protein [Deltaproteobacteria bacterium]
MKYRRFEDLPVWQDSVELARKMYEFTAAEPLRHHRGLRDQLECAALSVSNNVAERFERGTTKELLAFFYIARGSSGEVRSMLHVLNGWSSFGNFKSQIADLKGRSEKISKQLYGWIEILKNSEITEQRHFDDKQRTIYTGKKEREDFLEEIRRITEAAAEKRQKGRK